MKEILTIIQKTIILLFPVFIVRFRKRQLKKSAIRLCFKMDSSNFQVMLYVIWAVNLLLQNQEDVQKKICKMTLS